MNRKLLVALALLIAPLGLATAAEGRIPLLSLPGPPYVITQPGHYYLTRDIGGTPAAVVRIQSDGVTLDLNGFTVSGPTSFVDTTIDINLSSPANLRGITIRNGRTFGGAYGVRAFGTKGRIRVEKVEISGSRDGISLDADHAEVIDCHVHDLVTVGGAPGGGIAVLAYGGRIIDNMVQNTPGTGISALGLRGGEIRRNIVRNFGAAMPGAWGIKIDDDAFEPGNTNGAVLADNVVSGLPGGTDDYGIWVRGTDHTITGNAASYNGRDGILIQGPYNHIERNVTNRNGANGLGFAILYPHNFVVANQSQGNTGCGINVNGASTIYRDNLFAGNTGGNVCTGPGINAGGNYCNSALCP